MLHWNFVLMWYNRRNKIWVRSRKHKILCWEKSHNTLRVLTNGGFRNFPEGEVSFFSVYSKLSDRKCTFGNSVYSPTFEAMSKGPTFSGSPSETLRDLNEATPGTFSLMQVGGLQKRWLRHSLHSASLVQMGDRRWSHWPPSGEPC
jgi:hypothetical protein